MSYYRIYYDKNRRMIDVPDVFLGHQTKDLKRDGFKVPDYMDDARLKHLREKARLEGKSTFDVYSITRVDTVGFDVGGMCLVHRLTRTVDLGHFKFWFVEDDYNATLATLKNASPEYYEEGDDFYRIHSWPGITTIYEDRDYWTLIQKLEDLEDDIKWRQDIYRRGWGSGDKEASKTGG